MDTFYRLMSLCDKFRISNFGVLLAHSVGNSSKLASLQLNKVKLLWVVMRCPTSNGVGNNFEVGGRRGEARRALSGDRVLGEGTASPSPPTRRFAGAL